MDLVEFNDLIDDYQDAQRDGGFSDRAKARGALKDAFRALEAERDALRKSVDQLADTLKNVHEAVCETLGIEGDDALPELVADWAEGEYAALRQDAERFLWLESNCGNGLGLANCQGEVRQTWFVRFPVIESGVGMILGDAIDAAIAAKGAQS